MHWLLRVAFACSCVAFAAARVGAQEDERALPPMWEGVWKGVIGKSPVHVCLGSNSDDLKGAYYYDRVRRLLRLVPGAGEDEWFEQETYGKNGARWSISAHDGTLTGTWSNGRRRLPVRLTRIEGSSEEMPCGSMAFHLPRLSPVQLASRHGTKDGSPYTTWTFKPGPWLDDEVEISTFTLGRPGVQVSKVNALLSAVLPKSDGTGDWLDCVAGNVMSSSMDGTWIKTIKPTVVSERWLAAMEHGEYYCGGPHPDNVNTRRTFDLVQGVEVDPLDWFGPQAVHREDLGGEYGVYKTLTPTFVAVLLKDWKREEFDCDEAMREQDSWNVGLERGTLVFSPNFPRVIMACGEDFKVPFARLQPWLNDEGKAAVASLPR